MQPDESKKPVVVREPDASKGARPVLRGEGGREASFLPSVRLEVASVAELISLKGVRFPSGSASISYPEITQKWSNKCHAFSDRRGPPWASSQQNSASRQVFLLPERYSYKIKVL